MIKNAIAYITRKKNRTIIIFIVLTLVLSCLYSCLSIMKSSNNLEKSLQKFSNSSLSITKKDGGYFNENEFKNLKNLKEIKEIVKQYNGIAKLTNTKAVDGNQTIERDDLPDNFKNVVSIEAINNIEKNALFKSGAFTIKKGRNIEKNDKNKIVVHEDFAKKNNLKLNDKIGLKFNKVDKAELNEEYKFEIVGIFSGKKHEKHTGLSSDFSENTMFVDYESGQKALNKKENEKVVNKLTLFTDNPENLEKTLKKTNPSGIDFSKYIISKDDNSFKDTFESLVGIKHIIRIMTYSIMAAGVIILSLILILWLRERIYEIGILLSIGFNKAKIIGQFIFELIFVSIPSIFASLLFGTLLLKQIVGKFISSDDTGTLANGLLNSGNALNGFVNFIESYAILIAIIVVSVVIASMMILIKKPKEILSKIS